MYSRCPPYRHVFCPPRYDAPCTAPGAICATSLIRDTEMMSGTGTCHHEASACPRPPAFSRRHVTAAAREMPLRHHHDETQEDVEMSSHARGSHRMDMIGYCALKCRATRRRHRDGAAGVAEAPIDSYVAQRAAMARYCAALREASASATSTLRYYSIAYVAAATLTSAASRHGASPRR